MKSTCGMVMEICCHVARHDAGGAGPAAAA
jgi:hypothetical protein